MLNMMFLYLRFFFQFDKIKIEELNYLFLKNLETFERISLKI